MKLASLKSIGNRDGELCVVNRDLTKATKVEYIAKTLQEALDHWGTVEARLNEVYLALNQNSIANSFPFDTKKHQLRCHVLINGLMEVPMLIMWS